MSTFEAFLPILNIMLSVGLLLGGLLALKRGYSKETGEIQSRVIDALKEEVSTLRGKVDDLEKERATQDRVIATIRYALKQYGLRITISGDFVTLNDMHGQSKTTRIQQPAQVKHLPVVDEEDIS